MAEEKKPKTEEKKVEIPENLKDIVKEIEELKLKDLAKLVKILEDKFDITAQAPVMAAPVQGAPTSGAAPAEEKTEFNVELKNAGLSKIQVIKIVKEITGKGLKESKEVADAAEKSPQVLKEKVKKEEAEALKKKLEEAGATVEIK
jgi:large subunit ribosomal protein L7/L12